MRRGIAAAIVTIAVLGATEAAAAAPTIHAHRGGSVMNGAPTFPEDTMPAFQNAAREGWVLELDVKLTQDNIPVVIHDATLDRTTNCTGAVRAITSAALAANCRADVLGSPGSSLPSSPTTASTPVPTLAEVLAFARQQGAFLNLEIKNVPTDSDFDPGSAFANRVIDDVVASGIPLSRVIVQSFWPPNLNVADQRLPGVETSLLTLAQANEGAPSYAAANGYEWVSPAWPVSASFVEQAHGLGRKVVPYTLNTASDIRTAGSIGVEAVITDDPAMAQAALGLTRPQLLPDRTRPRVRLSAPRYASDRSPTRRFRIRFSASDRGSGIARYTLQYRNKANASTRWRGVARVGRNSASFRGKPGRAYAFRLRARDRVGNRSRLAYDETVVPLDDRTRRLGRSRGWHRRRHAPAWARTVLRGRRGATAVMRFRGSRIALIASRTRRGARMVVTLDRKSRVVSTRGRHRHRRVVYRSRRLRPTEHVLQIRVIGRGRVDLDGLGVETGAAPRRRR
jgi:glycerophosphoryl diester phosphodiesterase